MQLSIKKGSHTASHAATLTEINKKLPEAVRYVVSEDTTHLHVKCQGIVEVVTSEGDDNAAIIKAVVQQVVAKGKMLTYASQVRCPNGKIYSSLPLCGKLGAISALVGKSDEAKVTKAKSDLAGLLAGL